MKISIKMLNFNQLIINNKNKHPFIFVIYKYIMFAEV